MLVWGGGGGCVMEGNVLQNFAARSHAGFGSQKHAFGHGSPFCDPAPHHECPLSALQQASALDPLHPLTIGARSGAPWLPLPHEGGSCSALQKKQQNST